MEKPRMISDKSTIVAICPPEQVFEQFSEFLGDTIRSLGLHMTLATLGDLKDEDVSRCITILHNAVKGLPTVNMTFEGEGYLKMPNGKYANIALANGPGLDMWRHKIASVLKSEGFLNSEIDGFLPHITLAFSDNSDSRLPDSFGFKAFPVDCIYFLRGSSIKVPIFVGANGHVAAERKLSPTGSD